MICKTEFENISIQVSCMSMHLYSKCSFSSFLFQAVLSGKTGNRVKYIIDVLTRATIISIHSGVFI